MTTGVIIGRFQVPALTLGHKTLIIKAYGLFDQVGFLLGCAEKQNKDNPLTFAQRVPMLQEWEPAFIVPVYDKPGDNEGWSKQVDSLVDDRSIHQRLGHLTLVGGRQSFIPFYTGRYPVRELDVWLGKSGTEVRKAVAAMDGTTEEFRKGVIWQVMNDIR